MWSLGIMDSLRGVKSKMIHQMKTWGRPVWLGKPVESGEWSPLNDFLSQAAISINSATFFRQTSRRKSLIRLHFCSFQSDSFYWSLIKVISRCLSGFWRPSSLVAHSSSYSITIMLSLTSLFPVSSRYKTPPVRR